jgi:outer membrane protein assembly factor BamB
MASGLSAPAVYGRRVIVASGATVCALDAESGRALWRIRLDTSQRALSPPTVTTGPDRLIVATNPLSARAVLHCLRPEDGSVLWKRDRGGPIHSVTVKGPAVYVRSESILALEAASGTVLWSSLMGGCSPLVALDHVVLASAGSDVPSLVALDGRTGARVWEQRLASSCSGLAVSDGTGFMAARDGALYAVRVAIPDGA